MLTGCVMRVMYSDVNADTAEILSANGCEVLVSPRQTCCGALHLHNGFNNEGKQLARHFIDSFGPIAGVDAIVINSAGCGSTLKEYGRILDDDPVYSERAAQLAAKCRDISEFLVELGWTANLRSVPATATYHDACHLAQAQRITDAPRQLLSMIPGLSLVPLTECEVCCGSAGIYNLTEPEMATRLQDRKVQNIIATAAGIVVTGNPGCMAWIAAGLKDRGIGVMSTRQLFSGGLYASKRGPRTVGRARPSRIPRANCPGNLPGYRGCI